MIYIVPDDQLWWFLRANKLWGHGRLKQLITLRYCRLVGHDLQSWYYYDDGVAISHCARPCGTALMAREQY